MVQAILAQRAVSGGVDGSQPHQNVAREPEVPQMGLTRHRDLTALPVERNVREGKQWGTIERQQLEVDPVGAAQIGTQDPEANLRA